MIKYKNKIQKDIKIKSKGVNKYVEFDFSEYENHIDPGYFMHLLLPSAYRMEDVMGTEERQHIWIVSNKESLIIKLEGEYADNPNYPKMFYKREVVKNG